MAAITVGGKLLDLAKKNKIPFIQISDTGIEPRMAIGFMLKALLKLVGDEKNLKEAERSVSLMKPGLLEHQGRILAKKLSGFVPIVYASQKNIGLAYNWKIKFNESAKIPSFANRLPELNHNEMTSFDPAPSTKSLSSKFYFIFLKDGADDKRIMKRMAVLEKMYRQRKLPVEIVKLRGKSIWQKIFSNLSLGDWVAYYLALSYGVEPEGVPMVEEFKRMIK
ncbi:hypothetical protein HYV91_00210 [Candidatus Wolfebacteria bacterium]|nr:hypothetical protein [Candidatus Wolfebacteria bacterium]